MWLKYSSSHLEGVGFFCCVIYTGGRVDLGIITFIIVLSWNMAPPRPLLLSFLLPRSLLMLTLMLNLLPMATGTFFSAALRGNVLQYDVVCS